MCYLLDLDADLGAGINKTAPHIVRSANCMQAQPASASVHKDKLSNPHEIRKTGSKQMNITKLNTATNLP